MIAELPLGAPGLTSPRDDSGTPDWCLYLGHAGSAASPGNTLSGSAALTRRETVRTAVILLLLLVSIVFAAIGVATGVRRAHPGSRNVRRNRER